MQTCTNCKNEFDHPEHFEQFLVRFKDVVGLPVVIPMPDLCPSCRAQRRFCFRNEMNLYRRQCSMCRKDIFSMYDNDAIFPVYCRECFWSDFSNYIGACKNCYLVYGSIYAEDCYDANFTENDELLYNYLGLWKVQRAMCSLACYNCHDLFYSDSNGSSANRVIKKR